MICRCQNHPSAAIWQMRTHFLVSVPEPSSTAVSVTRKCGSLPSRDAQKNVLRNLWDDASELLRPHPATSARFVQWTVSCSARYRGSSGSMPSVWRGEARATGVPGRQSVLYPTLRVLRGPALPLGDDQGHCRGTAPRLGRGEGTGQAVHACAAQTRRHPGSARHRHRRDLDPQGSYLPYRRERPDPSSSDLVRWAGSLGSEHGRVLSISGGKEGQKDPLGGDGHVEGVSYLDSSSRPAGGHSVRQVPCPSSSGKSTRHDPQARVRPASRQAAYLHQGPEVYVAGPSAESHRQRPQEPEAAAGGQQAPQHRVLAEGILRSAVGLQQRSLGLEVLRELASAAQMATS